MVYLQLKRVVVVVLVVIHLEEDKEAVIHLVDLNLHQMAAAEEDQGIHIQVIRQSSSLNLHDHRINVKEVMARLRLKEVVDWRKCYSEVVVTHIITDRNVIVDHMFQKGVVLFLVRWKICIEVVFER